MNHHPAEHSPVKAIGDPKKLQIVKEEGRAEPAIRGKLLGNWGNIASGSGTRKTIWMRSRNGWTLFLPK